MDGNLKKRTEVGHGGESRAFSLWLFSPQDVQPPGQWAPEDTQPPGIGPQRTLSPQQIGPQGHSAPKYVIIRHQYVINTSSYPHLPFNLIIHHL